MLYTIFTKYPLEIQGITEASENKIQAIFKDTKKQIDYSGDVADIEEPLKYFVFWHFCENILTNVSATTGETAVFRDESMPEVLQMMRAWNRGVDLLSEILEEKNETANSYYLSKINRW